MFGGVILGRSTFGGDLAAEPRNVWAAPRVKGLKLKGINIVPRPTDSGNYDAVTPSNVYDMCYDFCVEGTTGACWLQWIKPQIDAAKAIGCDYVRWYWDATIRVGDATHHGTATWRGTVTLVQLQTAIANVCNYLASIGMWYYPTAMEAAQADTGGALGNNYGLPHTDGGLRLESAAILQYVDEFVTAIVNYPNVWAVDVLMEFTRADWAMESTHLNDVMTQARTSRGVSTLPLTCSIWDGPPFYPNYTPGAVGWAPNYDALLRMCFGAQMDFFDFHIYSLAPGPFIDFAMNNLYNLPCVIGETGLTQTGFYFQTGSAPAQETVHPYASELRARHYQDVVASWGHRFDMQCLTVYGVTDQNTHDDGQKWGVHAITQDAAYRFTSPKMEEVGPFQTVPASVRPYNVEHVLDLTGPDTTYGSWANLSSFMLGWAQGDFANRFTRFNHKVRRANAAFGYGVLNYYGPASVNQSVSVDFDPADAVPSGGRIDWAVSLRHPYLAGGSYYVAIFTSNPFDAAIDGLLSVWASDAGLTQIATAHASLPLDLTKHYQLSFSATGIYPTTLVATVTNVTDTTTTATVTVANSSPTLQAPGVPGLPCSVGQVDYTNVRYVSTGDPGPSLAGPVFGSATSTSITFSWSAAEGGNLPYAYLPEYVELNTTGFPPAEWTTLAPQTTTSATVTGLTPSTSYAFRIQVRDNTNTASLGNRAYSPWLRASTFGATGIAASVVAVRWVAAAQLFVQGIVLAPVVTPVRWVVGANELHIPTASPPGMTVRAYIELELAGAGNGWTDVSADTLYDEGVTITRGLSGGGPKDLVAATGTAQFALNNSAGNSAGLEGYYSRYHANTLTGWDVGIGFRVRYRDPGTSQIRTQFVGWIDSIDPIAGVHGPRAVHVTATDFIDDLARWQLIPEIGEQINQTGNAILQDIVTTMPRQPTAMTFDNTTESYPYALDQSAIGQSALAEAGKLASSEVGLIYVKADGTLRFEGRLTRLVTNPVVWAITDADLVGLALPTTREEIINTVRVTVHRKLVDEAATTVVYSQVNAIPIASGEAKFLLGPFRDPETGDPIGATDVQTPVAGTDYLGNVAEDGTGVNATASLTVSVAIGASGAAFTVTNIGSELVYLTRNRLRGRGIYDRGTITVQARDAASVTAVGEHAVEFDMPYQAKVDVGQGVAEYLLTKWSPSAPQVRMGQVVGKTSALLTQILTREISDRVRVTETLTGAANEYFINGIVQRLSQGVLVAMYLLTPAEDHAAVAQYWLLGTSTLGVDTIPAPF